MYMWVAIHMLMKRLTAVGKYREENPAPATGADTLTIEMVRELTKRFDTFQRELQRAEERKEAGNECYRQQAWLDAIREYSKAIEVSPPGDDNRYIYFSNRAACFNQVGEYTRAVEDCTIALTYNARFFKTLYRRAQAYERLGKKAHAIADLEQLLVLHPNNSQGREYYNRITGKVPATADGAAAGSLQPAPSSAPAPAPMPEKSKEESSARIPEYSVGASSLGSVVEQIDLDTDDGGKKKKKKKKQKKRPEEEEEDRAKLAEQQRLAAEEIRMMAEAEERKREEKLRKERERKEKEKLERERRDREAQERKEQRERAEREKREKKAKEEQERRDREDRERREKEERELARRVREQQRRDQKEREERERRLREDRERAVREKEERGRREKEERERREREERRERQERKEKEKADRERERQERERKEREERERKAREKEREKERKERERREREREAKQRKEEAAQQQQAKAKANGSVKESAPMASSPVNAWSKAADMQRRAAAGLPQAPVPEPEEEAPEMEMEYSAAQASPYGALLSGSDEERSLPPSGPSAECLEEGERSLSPCSLSVGSETGEAGREGGAEVQDVFLSRFGLASPPVAEASEASGGEPASDFAAALRIATGSLFNSSDMHTPARGGRAVRADSDESGSDGSFKYRDVFRTAAGGGNEMDMLLDPGVLDSDLAEDPGPGSAGAYTSGAYTLEQEVAGNTSANSFFAGLNDVNPIADALSNLFQQAGIQPTQKPAGNSVVSPFNLADRFNLSGIVGGAPQQGLAEEKEPDSPRGLGLLDASDGHTAFGQDLGTRYQFHPLAHRRLDEDAY